MIAAAARCGFEIGGARRKLVAESGLQGQAPSMKGGRQGTRPAF
jgi:hypothetical protein